MKFSYATAILGLLSSNNASVSAFQHSQGNRGPVGTFSRQQHHHHHHDVASFVLFSSSTSSDDQDRKKQIIQEETQNAQNLAASAQMMKNMTPQDMDKMLEQLDNMPKEQLEQFKAMGMDPTLMKKSMQVMKDNPAMMKSAQKMMESMTPEQILEQSKLAQGRMKEMTPEMLEKAAETTKTLSQEQLDEAAQVVSKSGTSQDPVLLEVMFCVGEYMSTPPSGGMTFQAFAALPPITALSGERDEDLSKKELAECWASGSLGSSRVDRAGFARVWKEVQELFEDDIMGEARKTINKRAGQPAGSSRRGSFKSTTTTPATTSGGGTTTKVGENLTKEQMNVVNEQVKNMSDGDMQNMLEQMSNIGPEEEARMRAMGVNPDMMKKATEMMKSNPMMRKAAQTMMQNMTPDQMMAASQRAQEQMKNMSEEDLKKAMDQMDN